MGEVFKMPKLGMDMEEGTIVKWLKTEGESVNKGDPLAEIETDKSTVEVESPASGILLKIYYPEGAVKDCGTPIAVIGELGEEIPAIEEKTQDQEVQSVEETVVEEKQDAISLSALSQQSLSQILERPGGKLRVTPRARRLAQMNNVDLQMIKGSGPNGRIVEQDVRDTMKQGTVHRKLAAVRSHQEIVKPLSGIRKIVANRMYQSVHESAQTNTRMEVNMYNAVSFRQQLNRRYEDKGIKISYLDIIIAACAKALIEHPQANCALMPDGIHYKNFANIGVAVDTERGLVVPVIKDADILSLPDIHSVAAALIDKARMGTLLPDEMSGGTFTISNLGMFEVDSFTAIINPPETCILAVGRIADCPVVEQGQIVVRPIMNLCLSYDHRVIDGAPSAKFLRTIKHYLENPVWLILN